MSVRARIRDVIRKGKLQGAREISTEVLRNLPDEELRAALEIALPYLVSDEIRKHRHEAIGRAPVRGHDTHRAFAEPLDIETTISGSGAGSVSVETSVKRRDAARKGTKAAAAKRERDSLLLRTPMALGPGEHKALGDCTAEDLRKVAAGLRDRADECSEKAGRWEAVATWLDQEGLTTVRELDGAKVREVAGVG